MTRAAAVLTAFCLFGCDRKPKVAKALPPSATDVTVSRVAAPGSPEGDATLTVTARFPDPAACQAFIARYAPREGLAANGRGYSRDDPGRESRSLRCDGSQMVYESVLY